MPNGLLVGALRAQSSKIVGVLAGEVGLLGACSCFSDALLVLDVAIREEAALKPKQQAIDAEGEQADDEQNQDDVL